MFILMIALVTLQHGNGNLIIVISLGVVLVLLAIVLLVALVVIPVLVVVITIRTITGILACRCGVVIKRRNYLKHVQGKCGSRIVKCPSHGCTQVNSLCNIRLMLKYKQLK